MVQSVYASSYSVCICIVYIGERIVDVGGTECMCGGTHVKNTADIRHFTATKIKKVSLIYTERHVCLVA